LVYVRGKGWLLPYSEDYKRYRFEDIQALSVVRRSRLGGSLIYSLGLLAFGGLLSLSFALMSGSGFGGGTAFLVSILALGTLLFAVLLVRHLILGPTCYCEIQTNFSQDRLLPLTRYHAAREIIAGIEGEIREVQATRIAEEVGAASSGEDDGLFPFSAPTLFRRAFSIPRTAVATFLSGMGFGLVALAALHLETIVLPVLLLVGILAVSFLLTFSLVASVRKPTPGSIRTALWILLGLLVSFVGVAVIYLLFAVVENPEYSAAPTGPLEAFAAVANQGGLGFYLIFAVSSLALFFTGLAGMVESAKWSRKILASQRSFEKIPSQLGGAAADGADTELGVTPEQGEERHGES
jgi:hypothetical protein